MKPKNEQRKRFCDRIKRAIGGESFGEIARRLNRIDQARAAKYAAQTISNWADGSTSPPLDVLESLAKATNCRVEYFVTGKTPLRP